MKHSFLRDLYRECRELYYLYNNKPRGFGYILMLHRIGDPNPSGLPQSEGLKVSVQHLDHFITEAKDEFDIIRLEDVPNRLKEKHKKRFLAFTFDDGYKEIITMALPVFQKHNVPFTVFLTTGFLERNAILWWDNLERIILSNESLTLATGNYYSIKTRKEKIEAFNQLSGIINHLNKNNFQIELANLFKEYHTDWYYDTKNNCLEWSDVSTLLSYPLITIGSHTHSHFKLDNLQTEKDVEDEILKAIALIRERTGYAPKVFAYPYGGAGQREFEVLSSHQNRIPLAVLAHGGPVTSNTNRLEQMPRIIFDNNLNVKDLQHYRNVYMGII